MTVCLVIKFLAEQEKTCSKPGWSLTGFDWPEEVSAAHLKRAMLAACKVQIKLEPHVCHVEWLAINTSDSTSLADLADFSKLVQVLNATTVVCNGPLYRVLL